MSSASSKIGTVALVVRFEGSGPELVATLSDDQEIALLESALQQGQPDPISRVEQERERMRREEEEFGDYVEELLSRPFVRPEIQQHGVQWLRSKLRIEKFQKSEREATQIISEYAYRIFRESPWRKDFFLAGPNAKVRIRIFTLDRSAQVA
jgi:hypothetical protein